MNVARPIKAVLSGGLLFSGIVALWALLPTSYARATEQHCRVSFSNGQSINVPVAASEKQQAVGLSNTPNIGEGMLFVWDAPAPRAFWMKDTEKNLDVGFFDGAGRLFTVEPMKAETTNFHLSMNPARWALELPQGGFQKLGLRPGMTLKVDQCR